MFTQSLFFTLFLLLGWSAFAKSPPHFIVDGSEHGESLAGAIHVIYDDTAQKSQKEIADLHHQGVFQTFDSNVSTGLIEGAVWSHFSLSNSSTMPVNVLLEYIDHQLIEISAFSDSSDDEANLVKVADMSMFAPFAHRPVQHNRFVFAVELAPKGSQMIWVKYSPKGKGFVFPTLRLWSPENLQKAQRLEMSGLTFLIGGFSLMAAIALVAGFMTHIHFLYAYSFYAASKIVTWATVMGYTHQFVLTESFHWKYMSISSALSIFFGLLFTRLFLNAPKYTPKLDYALQFMMANAVFLFFAALFEIKSAAVMSVTLALFLYPIAVLVGLIRWRQGSKEAFVYAIAWTFLAAGLLIQAFRDLGFIPHNFVNYYWPPFASYTEMLVIMFAMGVRVNVLRRQKRTAEAKYRQQLETSKVELESLVQSRTRDLEIQKQQAQLEARTDALTGTKNRRSFFYESEALFNQRQSRAQNLSLLMFDIDNFKAINDTFGHASGDEALRTFSRVVATFTREHDVFARLGGEEFSLLFDGSKEDALNMAERLRIAVNDIQIDTPKGQLTFTTSIGIAHLDSANVFDDLMNQADKALYQAKRGGRNRVVENIPS